MRSIVFILAAALAFLSPSGYEAFPFLTAMRLPQATVIVGNSALTHRSRCDQDQRTIAIMISDMAKSPVLDRSAPGQLFDESVNIAAYALRNPNLRRIVFTFALFDMADFDTISLQQSLWYRIANRGIEQPSLLDRVRESRDRNAAARALLSGRDAPTRAAFRYRDVDYPDYVGLKRDYFTREQQAMRCPEHDGVDARFIEAYHAALYTQLPINPALVAMLGSLNQQATEHGIQLDVYLMPINLGLIGRFDAALVSKIQARVTTLMAMFKTAGITLTDLSAMSPAEQFADRWCACGHLLDTGRRAVATRLVL